MKKLLLIGTLLIAIVSLAADQPQIKNAKVEQRSASAGLEQQIRAVSGTAWIGYSAPVIAGSHNMCCYNGHNGNNQNCCGACGLEKHSSFVEGKTDCQGQLEPSKVFFVFMRVAQGQVEKVRMFSTNCQIDGSGMNVFWLNDVKSTDSVAYLAKLAESKNEVSRKDDVVDGAIGALAMHDDPTVNKELAQLMTAGHSEHVAEQASFWAGTLRGSQGYEIIAAELERNHDTRFRKHAVFALSQNSDPRSQKTLIDIARHDSDSEIRSESLFWLAQEAGKKVAGIITSAIEDDPNTDVKKKAVFALSQLPEDEGVPLLINQAEKNANPVVRKEAMFWLGQSGDKRAVDFIASVLER
jgi:hypothetical protein